MCFCSWQNISCGIRLTGLSLSTPRCSQSALLQPLRIQLAWSGCIFSLAWLQRLCKSPCSCHRLVLRRLWEASEPLPVPESSSVEEILTKVWSNRDSFKLTEGRVRLDVRILVSRRAGSGHSTATWKEVEVGLFYHANSERTRGKDFRMRQVRFGLDIRKKAFNCHVVRQWKGKDIQGKHLGKIWDQKPSQRTGNSIQLYQVEGQNKREIRGSSQKAKELQCKAEHGKGSKTQEEPKAD